MTNKPRKHEDDTAFNKLKRLLRLVKFVAKHGRDGVSWKDIRENVYRNCSET